jgi:hypothetical protein
MREQQVFGPRMLDRLADGEPRPARGNDRNASARAGNPGFLASVLTAVGVGFAIWVLLMSPFPG